MKDRRGKKIPRHGMSTTPEYKVWNGVIARCMTPSATGWELYGGRGIRVCDRWRKFTNFFADMGSRPSPTHSIERRDVNGHYEPENCFWATAAEQARNTRRNRFVVFRGKQMTVSDACDEAGLARRLVWDRINKLGWPIERALAVPVNPSCIPMRYRHDL